MKLLSSCIDICPQPRQGTWPFFTEWLLAMNGGTSSPPQSHLGSALHTTLVTMNWSKNELFLCKWSSIGMNLHNASFNWMQCNAIQFNLDWNPTWAPHYTTLVTMNWIKNELFLCKWSSIWMNLHSASFNWMQCNAIQLNLDWKFLNSRELN